MWSKKSATPISEPAVPDFQGVFSLPELEKRMSVHQAKVHDELAEHREKMRLDMLKDIQKQNERCKDEIEEIYIRTGKFPSKFKCSVLIHSSTFWLDQFHSIERLPILTEIQKTCPNKITFGNGEISGWGEPHVEVTLNKLT